MSMSQMRFESKRICAIKCNRHYCQHRKQYELFHVANVELNTFGVSSHNTLKGIPVTVILVSPF